MGKITNVKTNKEVHVNDGENIRKSCEKLGVPFQCTNGICGTCIIDIVSGQENLSELTKEEKDLGRDKEHRLACQCKIKKGDVKFKVSY
tara:strand:+ start:5247 stop:5513 length:267 start_codon:yes stop_codon:yes gene_type:complete